MVKNIVLIFSILLLSILLVGTAYILKNKDLCCNNSLCRQLTNICIEMDDEQGVVLSVKGEKIYLENLNEGDEVEVGTEIKGSVKGVWYFEGVFPVRVLNSEGEVVDTLIAQAKEDWMQEGLVPFSFIFNIELDKESELVLLFEKSNPSGLEEYEDYAQIRIRAKTVNMVMPEEETITLKVYFANENMGSREDCSNVFPIEREIPKTVTVARAALEELFKGLAGIEPDQGYFTNIPYGIEIQSLSIVDGVARVDLSKELDEGVGGSCRVTSIRAQIEETLKQFTTVNSVIISRDGMVEDILQP